MEGTFSVSRKVWDHYLFKAHSLSRREAFLWMVSEAAFKPRRAPVRLHSVELKRGQFTHSIRFMSDKFGWKKGVTERFLDVLKTEKMIETHLEGGQLVITICNYDTYQMSPEYQKPKKGTQFGTETGHKQDTNRTKKNKANKVNKEEEEAAAPKSDLDLELFESQLREAARAAIDATAPGLAIMSTPCKWIDQGADLARDILPTLKTISARPRKTPVRDWNYFSPAVFEAMEQRKRGGGSEPAAPSGIEITWKDLSDADWQKLVGWYRQYLDAYENPSWKAWKACNGPPPGKPGCHCPPAILDEFGFQETIDAPSKPK